MISRHSLNALALVAALCAMPAMAADEHGHDHGPAAAPSGPALPRFAAVSDAFELVGVIDGKKLTLYLDSFEDNAPVRNAKVELEIGGAKLALAERADGEYEGTLAEALAPGVVAVTASIVAGGLSDLLAADLDLHAAAPVVDVHGRGWRTVAAWIAGALAVLGAGAVLRRRARMGAAA